MKYQIDITPNFYRSCTRRRTYVCAYLQAWECQESVDLTNDRHLTADDHDELETENVSCVCGVCGDIFGAFLPWFRGYWS